MSSQDSVRHRLVFIQYSATFEPPSLHQVTETDPEIYVMVSEVMCRQKIVNIVCVIKTA